MLKERTSRPGRLGSGFSVEARSPADLERAFAA